MSIKIGNFDPETSRRAAVHAEAERRFALAQMQCAGDLRRLGIKPTGEKIDPMVLQDALRKHKIEPVEAIRIKSALASILWLD
jgi:hypothetical protein